MVVTPGPADCLSVRPYAAGDEQAVLALLATDRLPGQPEATPAMLTEALAGRSPVDGGWWAELASPITEVVQRRTGEILGVVSHAIRPRDAAGLILWLHCREDPAVADALIGHTLGQLGTRTAGAFDFASALTLGVEGLPVRHRPVTREALEKAGFTGRDGWRYLHAPLPITGLRSFADCTETPSKNPPGLRMEVIEGGETVAEAVVGRPVAGIGVLWWIDVRPSARGRGLGSALLGSALDRLVRLGADEVILYVDDDAPPGDGERDRTAANRMYDRAGLREIDRLWSFDRPR